MRRSIGGTLTSQFSGSLAEKPASGHERRGGALRGARTTFRPGGAAELVWPGKSIAKNPTRSLQILSVTSSLTCLLGRFR